MFSWKLRNMKSVIKDKFKNNVLVKPLYRKLKNGNRIKPKMIICLDSNLKLDGHEISMKRNVVNHSDGVVRLKDVEKSKKIDLRDACEGYNKGHFYKQFLRNKNNVSDKQHGSRKQKMLDAPEIRRSKSEVGVEDKRNKIVQANNHLAALREAPSSWLRLYPLPKLPEETVGSLIFRCMLCQLGLSTFLILWTTIWTFTIQSFEGPYEVEISLNFEKQQNQLVIDLATELRQITPLSPRWKAVIEQRIDDARLMTLVAVTQGARLRPGQFWDLSGTFLFTIYVMTALGFGAPVPQTIGGRTSALIYAVLAVPIHVYLMLNASTCIVVHVELYAKQLRCRICDKMPFIVGKTTLDNVMRQKPVKVGGFFLCPVTFVFLTPEKVFSWRDNVSGYMKKWETIKTKAGENQELVESPNCSRNSELLKAPNKASIARKIMRCLSVFGACRSVPLAGILYYMTGACVFGVLRGHDVLDVIMFPLEFTTNGGLDHIAGHIRILYGFYVEGAMTLLACALATLRRHSNPGINQMSDKYRLFATAE